MGVLYMVTGITCCTLVATGIWCGSLRHIGPMARSSFIVLLLILAGGFFIKEIDVLHHGASFARIGDFAIGIAGSGMLAWLLIRWLSQQHRRG